MNILFLATIFLVMVGIVPAFAESQTQSTDGGTLDVKLDYDEIIPGELTTLRTDFINPQTQETQVHIDWTFSVSKDGKIIWGPTQLSHTSEGFLKNLRYEFESDGLYTIEFGVEGILFQPIPREIVSFDITVGDVIPSSVIPDWIKNNAGWWAQGQISDDDFLNGIQYLIGIGLITVEQQLQTQTLSGEFEDADFIHKTSGTAIVTIAGDSKTLDLANFETLNGPDLYVYMSADKSNKDFVDLGRLDKFKGDQSYVISDSVDIVKYHNVLIWCKAFGVLFGSAELSVVN